MLNSAVKISIIIMLSVSTILPIFIVIWLWFFHDRSIKKLREELIKLPLKINEEYRGRGVTASGLEPIINAAKRQKEIDLQIKESARQLFIERANFLSLFKFK